MPNAPLILPPNPPAVFGITPTFIEVQQKLRLRSLKTREALELSHKAGKVPRPAPFVDAFIRDLTRYWVAFLTFYLALTLLAQERSNIVYGLSVVFGPKIGDPRQLEASYGEDCEVLSVVDFVGKIIAAVYDKFFLSHLVGFSALAYCIRSRASCVAISIGFELVELSLQNWLPNFNECWWDHIFLDLLICNAIGTDIGLYFSHFRHKMHPVSCGHLRPLSFKEKPWVAALLVTSAMLSLLNGFFLKRIFLIQESHFLFPLRTLITSFELYYIAIDLNWNECKQVSWGTEGSKDIFAKRREKLAPFNWWSRALFPVLTCSMFQLGFVHFMVEFAVIYKFRIGLFDFDELPPVGIWYISALLFLWFVSCFTVGVIPYQTEKCPHDPDLLSGAERRFDDKIVELENWIHCERWGERIKALRIEERVLEMQVEKDKHEGITGKETAKMQKYLLKEQQKAGFAVDKKKMTRIKKKGKGKSD